ncbi:MAG TPA: glycerol-3-phosphate 1-O-acyltransferase PlsB [Accumulibacter sp.]|nr:glycerol-3-phosphate 1-O-acyltransferase PlsB [Accumulibacter sp.]
MAGWFDPSGWIFPLARRLLHVWVRTTVFPAQVAEVGVDPAKPVCYVLQDRHFSNTLLLAEETRRAGLPPAEAPLLDGRQQRLLPRSFFFLHRQRELLDRPSEASRHSPLLVDLIRQGLADPSLDVQLVPVVILWGRAPRQQDSIIKALFSETWRPPGAWQQLLRILLHGRNVLVRYNTPISLRGLLQEGIGQEQAIRKLSRVLRVHFRRQREMAIGPDLSHRHTQIDDVLAAERVRAAIAIEAQNHGITNDEARLRARRHALEIASDYSYGVLRALELLLNWLWTRLYDGIAMHNIDVVTRIAPGNEIVYIPCHRSHIDYLLLSYLIHRHGLTPPHIAAGSNLNLPLIGTLLRHGGAFFLRRSFKGAALYAAVFDEYLHLMLSRGFPIEYFIEGGCSRSGRTLPPKAGILGMTINSFIRAHQRPLVFVPVYIGYEKLLEGKTYLGELAGKPKQRESLWALLKTVRELKRVFGQERV